MHRDFECPLDQAQLFSTNAFSLNVLTTFNAIYSQPIVNTNNFLHTFIKENKYLENDIEYIRIKKSLRVIRLEVFGQVVLNRKTLKKSPWTKPWNPKIEKTVGPFKLTAI